MQDKQGEAFVIATCNDVDKLPPELLRKGRFDEVWFVDLPNDVEREAVLASALRQYGRGKVKVSYGKIAAATDGFTGSEIASLVPDALFKAFADGAREITTEDLIASAAHGRAAQHDRSREDQEITGMGQRSSPSRHQ